ncbi:hypothetical protein E2F46_00155 [Luteimonas aestuarii]|uniref:Uncharacterized protein n=1 Tax=Luteimonas aestuarii TaxID=453837 RepID=A0A4R5U3R3_9GAMM|nr:hypothetical protein E2F46_00155 [Luteimonas aestuarii]
MASVATSGCDRTADASGAGFSDGFASGYAEKCVLRAPAESRRWSNAAYTRGYADGVETGKTACRGEVARQGRPDPGEVQVVAHAPADRR